MTLPTLLTKHRDLALAIARGYVRRMPRHIERAELEHLALVGLWEWARRYPDDDAPGWRFGAARRIRGSILDDLRRQDWMPRRRGATSELRVIGADDVDPEWASHWASSAETPEDAVASKQAVADAWRATLDARARRIVRLRHERGHEWQDIAAELRISQPRACQIHGRALARMRAQVCDRGDALRAPEASPADARRSYKRAAKHPKGLPSMPPPVPADVPLPPKDAVTSTLPEDGLDLPAEVARYQAWLVDQALVRSGGNRAAAARLLGINRTTLVEMLRRGLGARRARAEELREMRGRRRAAGLCWLCGVPLDDSLVTHGSHAGARHARCATCRERRRASRGGTLNALPKNDHR